MKNMRKQKKTVCGLQMPVGGDGFTVTIHAFAKYFPHVAILTSLQ